MKQFVRESWKAIIAFFGVFISVLLARLSTGESPLPALDDLAGWLGLVGGCFGTAILTYAKRNVLTPKQVATGFVALPDHEQKQVVEAVGPYTAGPPRAARLKAVADDGHQPKHKLWVRVVEAHAARVWLAIILGVFAGLSLLVIAVGSVWNNLANPEVNDLAGNYNTLLASVLSLIFGGLVGFLGGSTQQTHEARPGEFPIDEDLTLDIDPSDESR